MREELRYILYVSPMVMERWSEVRVDAGGSAVVVVVVSLGSGWRGRVAAGCWVVPAVIRASWARCEEVCVSERSFGRPGKPKMEVAPVGAQRRRGREVVGWGCVWRRAWARAG